MPQHPSLSDLPADQFPVDVDVEKGTFFFREVSRQTLADTPFLDGRSTFWTNDASYSSHHRDLSYGPDPATVRLILHIGFCGSTLLASVLDQPGRAMVLREPHVLAALAHQAGNGRSITPQLWSACQLLSRRFSPAEAVVIKPTNWFNNLVPLLASAPQQIQPLFVTASRSDYLTAAFRGGRDRIAFITRLAAHLAGRTKEGGALWQSAAVAELDPLERAARIVLLARDLQHRLFRRAQLEGGWKKDRWISFTDLSHDLSGTAWHASRLLDLDLDRGELDRRCALAVTRNVKARESPYSVAARRSEDDEVWSYHRARFDAALGWASGALSIDEPDQI